jgi:hypothetical protein
MPIVLLIVARLAVNDLPTMADVAHETVSHELLSLLTRRD